jgi:Sulfite exporter TauE/SafE
MYGYNDIMGLSAWHLLALSAAGLVATALNTLAGGGSLISFPLLIMLGIPPIAANATNAFALTLGGVSGALSSTSSLPRIRQHLKRFALPAFVGALAGAWLLLSTSQALFNLVVPLLLLVATMLLGLRSVLTKRRHIMTDTAHALAPLCVIAVYGGYFGAGMGIVFLAVLDWFFRVTCRTIRNQELAAVFGERRCHSDLPCERSRSNRTWHSLDDGRPGRRIRLWPASATPRSEVSAFGRGRIWDHHNLRFRLEAFLIPDEM